MSLRYAHDTIISNRMSVGVLISKMISEICYAFDGWINQHHPLNREVRDEYIGSLASQASAKFFCINKCSTLKVKR
jgi:hypothetical protein